MSAKKFAVKRKISDKPPPELNSPLKKRKVEERQNLIKRPVKGPASPVSVHSEENISARQIHQKLSSILHFEKKYKYYCKKHNVLYLIENTRRRSREVSKKSRDDLVNSFRSLDLTRNYSHGKQFLENSQQLLSNAKDEFSDDERSFLSPTTSVTKSKITRIFFTSDENGIDNHFAQANENIPANKQSTNQLILSQLMRFILCDEEGDSDSDEGYREDNFENYESSKNEDFILTRSPGGNNIIMKKVKDSTCVKDYEDCCTHRNCLHNHYFKSSLSDYDSSFDSASFDGLYTG